ncbi:hypothetical protein Pyn_00381 [Prunus yedoensis var. nudiflora]|uniref:Uncharacterized protein n=1 Tax=Prunus yedoensis var. nudiflora TaxID=2094558 RepID=A0A314Y2A8_PRUYE|nr:hypothetical protein Pyn_00381 [Prunus yedoensis var. nudiflora]
MSMLSVESDADCFSSSKLTESGQKESLSSPTLEVKDPALESPPDSTGSIPY